MEDMIRERLRAFQTAAKLKGFVEASESDDGTVLWFRKCTEDIAKQADLRMCIDSLTNSVTIFWMSISGKQHSKTFRGAQALEDWFKSSPRLVEERLGS